MSGKLYIISTPIGNLSDISSRALEILSSVNLIAAEDTRVSRKLLNHYKIKNKLISYNDFNENFKAKSLLGLLKNDKNIAVISDAGTPCISDPGYKIVNAAKIEAQRCIQCPSAPCQEACPVSNDIPGAFALIEEGDILGAADIFRETSNLPEMCGRLCPQESLCEGSCVVGFAIRPTRPGSLRGRIFRSMRSSLRSRSGIAGTWFSAGASRCCLPNCCHWPNDCVEVDGISPSKRLARFICQWPAI